MREGGRKGGRGKTDLRGCEREGRDKSKGNAM